MHVHQTLKKVPCVIRDILVFLDVAFPTHPDRQAILDRAAAVVARHLGSVGLPATTGTGLLTLTVWLHFTCTYNAAWFTEL